IRRVLRGSEDVCEVTVIRRTCRVLLDAGAAPRLLRALAARGLPIAVVTVAVQGAEPRPEDAAVADQWQQAETSPRQALTPSRTATAASATATAGSTHHQPMVFNPRPASTPPAMTAHSRFWVPSPAVDGEPSRAPSRRLATPSRGMLIKLIVVTAMPSTVGSAR